MRISPVPQDTSKAMEEIPASDKLTSNNEAFEAEKHPAVMNLTDGDSISSPIEIIVNSEGLWHAFEGELGVVKLFDEMENELGLGILSTDENWMQAGPVIFKTILSYSINTSGKGRLVFTNNNASDNRALDKSFEMIVFYGKN